MKDDGDHRTVVGAAQATVPAAPLIVTTDVSLAHHVDDLVEVLHRAGLRVERRTFQPTPPDDAGGATPRARGAGGPPMTPVPVEQALSAALFPRPQSAEPATLQ